MRNLDTFTTHVGLRKYKRFMFGINTVSGIFQKTLYQSLHGLSGVMNITDDILVYGNCKTSHGKTEGCTYRFRSKTFDIEL